MAEERILCPVLHVGPYEVLITLFVLALITLGPVVAGLALAWVRSKKRPPPS